MTSLPDTATIRGFNHEQDLGAAYDPCQTERELDLAGRLTLNSCRLFLRPLVWQEDPDGYVSHIRDFLDAAQDRAITVTPILWLADDIVGGVSDPELGTVEPQLPNCYAAANYPRVDAYLEHVITALRGHPAVLFWDVQNEPSWHTAIVSIEDPAERTRRLNVVWKLTRHMIATVRRLDPETPLGVGHTYITDTDDSATGDLVDVILFHDYSRTRARARAVFAEAAAVAERYQKPVINNEMGALVRGSTYESELQLAQEFGIGYYLFKLMVEPGMWQGVHGIVYPDGSVRDPAIVAAIHGFYRNRDPESVIPVDVNLEHDAERALDVARRMLRDGASAADLLDAAEFMANLLEGGELVAMADGPMARIERLKRGPKARLADARALVFEIGEQLRTACSVL